MNIIDLKFAKTRDVLTPTIGTSDSAGIDFYVPTDYEQVIIRPGESILINTGLYVNIPKGYALLGVNRSSVASKMKLTLGAKLIDSDYQGEMFINLINIGTTDQVLTPDTKIAQFILIENISKSITVVDKDDLYSEVSERGIGGFGSTN